MKNIIYGIHNIEYYINKKKKLILKSYIFFSKFNKNYKIKLLINKFKINNIPIDFVSKDYINNLTKNKSHQNICIQIKNDNNNLYLFDKNKFIKNINNSNKKSIFLILENITNPRNLGACLRNADSAGVNTIIITKNNSSPINDIVRKSSSGCLDNLNIIRIDNIKYIIKLLKKNNIKIIATSNKCNNILYNVNLKFPIAFIFGSEEYGVTNFVKKNCDIIVKIPMYGYVNSLNVSVSVGICLFEFIRQNNFSN